MSKERGQSLIETLVALSVMVVGIAGAVSLGIISIRAGQTSQLDVVAENLAREGIEAARAVRDYNWTYSPTWDRDLGRGNYRVEVGIAGDPAAGQVILDAGSSRLENSFYHLCLTQQGQYLHMPKNMMGNCTDYNPTWAETVFNRWVTVTPYVGGNKILITCEVRRSGGVGTVTYTVAEDLYNWQD